MFRPGPARLGRPVLLLGQVPAPSDGASLIIDLVHGEMKTSPLNQSFGPAAVSSEFLMISTGWLLV